MPDDVAATHLRESLSGRRLRVDDVRATAEGGYVVHSGAAAVEVAGPPQASNLTLWALLAADQVIDHLEQAGTPPALG